MKTASVFTLILLLVAGSVHAQQPGLKVVGGGSTDLTELIAGSHWAWYEGNYDRYTKGKMVTQSWSWATPRAPG